MSWGIRITTLYLGFVALIITLVVTCFGHKTELESKDYYARELKFQEQINAEENSNNLNQPISYELGEHAVQIVLPQEILSSDLSGTITFVRPSDSSKDKTIPLQVDGKGVQNIDAGFEKGVYKMKIFVMSAGKNYFKEAVIKFK